jgi:hypothetical protein
VANKYRVPAKQWKRWSKAARAVFNRVYDFAYNNECLMTHPGQDAAKPVHWKTIAWNAAWIAADAVDDTIPTRVITVQKARKT